MADDAAVLRSARHAAAQRDRNRARREEAVRHYFAALGYTDQTALDEVVAEVLRDLSPTASPGHAVAHARNRLDHWLREFIDARLRLPRMTPEMGRAALITIEAGRHWPRALFAAAPPSEFVEALHHALPVALPPECPLEMPPQSLTTTHDLARSPLPPPHVPGLIVRRLFVFGATFLTTVAATYVMARVFSPGGISAVEVLLMVLFAINFLWIALTFWTALLGLRAGARSTLPPGLVAPAADLRPPRTAILLPVYNEDPTRIFASLSAMFDSLRETGELDAFDFFILSDSTNPDAWIREEIMWDEIRRRLRATGRLFYRRRFENTARKAGNIAEFCERWGGNYEAMLILDADSLMEGTTIVEMARILAANPGVGLLQTVPQLINRNTLFARAQQFAGRLYGPILASGLAAWHGGDGNYWGHNAIIRVRAFAAHAGMPELPGRAPFGGHILSHDFVEAALLRRAGWGVFMLTHLGGSYEESPPSLLDHAQRDRRWCQGNLQHMAVLGAAGLHPLSRLHLLTGIMSYLSSPLWFAFIVVGIIAALQTRFELPQYFFPNRTPYPVWHIIDPELALRLFVATMAVLLAPKFVGWLAIVARPAMARAFGGRLKALGNLLFETLLSALTAPVQMLFQSRFVLDVLLGRDSGWKTQSRDDSGVMWRDAWQRHRFHTAAGIVLGVAAYAVVPSLAAWMAPALIGMLFAAPVSYYTSRLRLGMRARACGLLAIPEEREEPGIARAAAAAAAIIEAPAFASALATVIGDNRVGNLHLALLSQYAPSQISESMALAHYRAHTMSRGSDLAAVFPLRLQAAALAERHTVRKLRRIVGKYRE